MGVIIPQVVTSDRASGAQVIDGSLKFDDDKDQYLKRTPSSSGNTNTWTFSCWIKRDTTSVTHYIIRTPSVDEGFYFNSSDDKLDIYRYSGSFTYYGRSPQVLRDAAGGWYHIVYVHDSTAAAGSRLKIYINSVLASLTNLTDISSNTGYSFNTAVEHRLGEINGRMSQVYFIDGQALDASYFGFTDPLTNTWKPKKYEGTFGTNGFYLPMDGNSPIGQDKSGNGNDWTPVNFGGSLELDNPNVSGARPILNTTQGGTQAGVGVFGSRENVGYAVTYYDDGDGNKYYIDGVKQATLTGLIRGATYTFDTVALGSTHPFRFSATSAHGTEYTNGVAAITGTATTITIPYDAPETLYYYCTAHSGMGSSITGITTNEKLADQYASDCVLALPLVGANSDVSASITCTSSTKSVTSNGNAAAANESSNFYSGSFEFDGNDDALRTDESSELTLGTGAFTIECWFNRDNITDSWGALVADNLYGGTGGWVLYTNTNDIYFYKPGSYIFRILNVIVAQTWTHIAVQRDDSGNWSCYLNGIDQEVSASDSINFTNNRVCIAANNFNGQYPNLEFNGYIQDVRLYKGVAKYTSDFVVPSTSPDILPDTPSGVSGSSKLTKITDGAVSFDGSGDYLSGFGGSAILPTSTGTAFVVDCFWYSNGNSTQKGIWEQHSSGSGRTAYFVNNGSAYLISEGNTVGSFTYGDNRWYFTRIIFNGSGDIYHYVNGVLIGSGTQTNGIDDTGFQIGAYSTDCFNGFISNFRIVVGSNSLSGTDIPTAPLTNVTDTKLLCCQSNTLAGAAAVSPNISGINDGIVWSEEATITPPSSGFNSGGGISQAFDGSTTTLTSGAGSRDEFFVIDFSRDITVSTSLEVWMNSGASQFKVNDGSFSSSLNNGAWRSLSFTGTLSKLTVKGDSPQTFGNFAPRLSAIRIDGSVILTDPVTRNGDAAATNFNPFNTDINTVRGQETGYATWNPLKMGTSDVSMSEGNLFWRTTSNGPDRCTYSTIGMDSGKFYWENEIVEATATAVGIANASANQDGGPALAHNWMYYSATGQTYIDGSASSYGDAYNTNGTIIGVAFDRDNLTLEFYKNGVSQGKLTSISGLTDSETYFAMCGDSGGSSQSQVRVNFGQKPFKFPPPDGFQPLNAANVRPETVISRPDQYVGVTTYSGSTGTGTIKDDNINFTPDFVWVKDRGGTEVHALYDTVRGSTGGNFYRLSSSSTNGNNSPTNELTSMIRGGFTANNNGHIYYNGKYYVSWMWKAGGNKNTFNVDDVGYATAAAAGLTGGDITPSGASVGTKQGFSIIKFTGSGSGTPSIPHGLLEAPTFIIQKDTGATTSWRVFAYDGSTWKIGNLNNTDAFVSATETAPTSSLFYANGNGNATNTQIAYLWHDVPGLQKFGTYEGNNNADGPFVELGFNPSIIWTKGVDSANHGWEVHWNSGPSLRQNPQSERLMLNENVAKATTNHVDFLSNGFKIRNTFSGMNNTTDTYIYCAWADVPSVDLFGGGANAR